MGNLTVKFAKPYKFEGTEYDEVDLSGMDGMTIQDMIDIQKKLAGEIRNAGSSGGYHLFCAGSGNQGQRQTC